MAQEATKNLHLRHEETWSAPTSCTTKCLSAGTEPTKLPCRTTKRPSREMGLRKPEMGLRKPASCTCPVFYCISVIYDFFPKAVEVGKMREAIECQPFDGQPS